MRAVILSVGLMLASGLASAQQAETLADIRNDLSTLNAEIVALKSELSSTGGSSASVSGSTLDRMNAIETALQRLTAKTEELEFRINRVVKDGTNRIGDLEFRLVELEGGDLGAVGETSTLGGGEQTNAPAAATPTPTELAGGVQLAIGEETDFRRAQEALANGDFRSAADQFAAFRQTYPGGPLEAQALLDEGRALEGMGDFKSAAKSYLDAYSGFPQSDVAPDALFHLGASLGKLGKTREACLTLSEVGARYPGADAVQDARVAMSDLGCS